MGATPGISEVFQSCLSISGNREAEAMLSAAQVPDPRVGRPAPPMASSPLPAPTPGPFPGLDLTGLLSASMLVSPWPSSFPSLGTQRQAVLLVLPQEMGLAEIKV